MLTTFCIFLQKKTLHIYELTMPLSRNIDARHTEKTLKYTHFLTDITGYTTTLNCFEVSSTGFVNKSNHTTLDKLHKLMRKDLKKSVFKNNLNALAWYGSYQIWISRENPEFAIPPFLIPHIGDINSSTIIPWGSPHLSHSCWSCNTVLFWASTVFSLNPPSGCFSNTTVYLIYIINWTLSH